MECDSMHSAIEYAKNRDIGVVPVPMAFCLPNDTSVLTIQGIPPQTHTFGISRK